MEGEKADSKLVNVPCAIGPLLTNSVTNSVSGSPWTVTLTRTEISLKKYSSGDQWLREVRQRYAELQRRYHSLGHVEHMLDLMSSYLHLIQDSEAVTLATIFHE